MYEVFPWFPVFCFSPRKTSDRIPSTITLNFAGFCNIPLLILNSQGRVISLPFHKKILVGLSTPTYHITHNTNIFIHRENSFAFSRILFPPDFLEEIIRLQGELSSFIQRINSDLLLLLKRGQLLFLRITRFSN